MGRYAREHGVPANSLAYWVKRDAGEAMRLVRVQTDALPAEAEVSVVVDGAVLRTSTAASAEWMAQLLRRLGRARMWALSSRVKVYLASGAVDGRKGAGGLMALVQGVLIASAFNVRRVRRTALVPATS